MRRCRLSWPWQGGCNAFSCITAWVRRGWHHTSAKQLVSPFPGLPASGADSPALGVILLWLSGSKSLCFANESNEDNVAPCWELRGDSSRGRRARTRSRGDEATRLSLERGSFSGLVLV